MQRNNPYEAYTQVNINTADQRQLIMMLYDGALRFMKKGVKKIEQQELEGAHNYLVRSREIVAELLATLRPEKGGELGDNLKRLYTYAFNRLVEANLLKDPEIVEEVIGIMSTLRDGWAQIKTTGAKTSGSSEDVRKISLTM